jgi:hypothetical protein
MQFILTYNVKTRKCERQGKDKNGTDVKPDFKKILMDLAKYPFIETI